MADWDRKNLDVLHSAIAKKIHDSPALADKVIALIAVKNHIVMSFGHDAETLRQCRSELCTACRKNQLYACDQDEGWSPNCAFLKANYE